MRLARSQQRRVQLVTETRRQRTEVNPPSRAAPTKKLTDLREGGEQLAGYHITKLSLLLLYGRRKRGGGREEEEPRFLNLLRFILQLSNALVKIFKARCDTCNAMFRSRKANLTNKKMIICYSSYLASFAGVYSVVES